MPLGLDLRGGLYLLYQVDVDGAVAQLLQVYEQDFRRVLGQDKVAYSDIVQVTRDSPRPNGLRILLPPGTDVDAARASLRRALPDLTYTVQGDGAAAVIETLLTPAQIRERQDYAIQQNLTTLRNRVNELGVSEPIVQRQGIDRINVQLPGVQNSAEVKDILGKVATLEFRLVDINNSVAEAAQRNRAPIGSKLYKDKAGLPVLLKRDIIVTGDQLVDAMTAATQDGPGVSVKLDALRRRRDAAHHPRQPQEADGGGVHRAASRGDRGGRPEGAAHRPRRDGHQHGHDPGRVLHQLPDHRPQSGRGPRAGAAAARRRAGRADLRRRGTRHRPFARPGEHRQGRARAVRSACSRCSCSWCCTTACSGWSRTWCCSPNVVLLAALLSGLKAALSLPGIAGIVLTVGMAVDANVLIYERIREELRNGVTPQAAIAKGFEKAFSAIADSNVTTLISGVVLWVFGTGPIRGFAVTLCLGIATSMFTSILGSRALLTLMYGGKRKVASLPI